jgi:anti-sigma factor RsiW
MLGCSEQRLSEYIDGDLPPAAVREVERHLLSCPSCREMLLDLRALVAAIRVLLPSSPNVSRPRIVTSVLRQELGSASTGPMCS